MGSPEANDNNSIQICMALFPEDLYEALMSSLFPKSYMVVDVRQVIWEYLSWKIYVLTLFHSISPRIYATDLDD